MANKTNGEAFMELLDKMHLYMERPPGPEHDGFDTIMRFSWEWWDRPVGHRRCKQCGKWFESTRKNHIYCSECAAKRKREAQDRSHNTEIGKWRHRVYNRYRKNEQFIAQYKSCKTREEKDTVLERWEK